MKADDLTLTELACYFALAVIAFGIVCLGVTAVTRLDIFYRLTQAALAPLPLWAFLIIIAAMADEGGS